MLSVNRIIHFEESTNWPDDIRALLVEHDRNHIDIDTAVHALAHTLRAYSLVGFHCTRLAPHEVENILAMGMQTLSVELVERRVDAAMEAGLISKEQSVRLKASHLAADEYRAKMIHFCFFEPHRDSGGANDFFDHWGGEALYNNHECDAELGPLLASIGRPAIIEAEVPIAWLHDNATGLAIKIRDLFARTRGFHSYESSLFEDHICQALPARLVRAVHLHPSAEFNRLAGSGTCWNPA